MNDLGLLLLGASVRGTLLVLFGLLLGWALRRKGPAASATVALATLLGMVGLSALGASPWPRWWDLGAARVEASNRVPTGPPGPVVDAAPVTPDASAQVADVPAVTP